MPQVPNRLIFLPSLPIFITHLLKNKSLIKIIPARDIARIQDEDDNLAQKKKLTKQRARESLESQIDLSQSEAKKELIKGRKKESYKNQVFFLEK